MKDFIKSYWKTLLFFALVGAVGGFGVGFYLLDSYPEDMVQEMLSQGATPLLLALVTAVQSAGYGLVLGSIGIWLGKKTGLWRDERSITRQPLMASIVISVVGGMALILPDIFYFGKLIPAIADSYAVKPTIPYLVATVTYGAVIEEVMLRLFWMSLMVFVLWKLFQRKREHPSTAVVVSANVIAALLFAAGHLPTTFLTIGTTPLIILRCFLLNGTFGLAFGWLYRKHGLRYAMMAHGGCHVVSKLIWILWL
jgi:hypothetical protein